MFIRTLTFFLLLSISSNLSFYVEEPSDIENLTPIIGILSQELSSKFQSLYPGYKSFVPASYVKFVESAGARLVPIWIGQPRQYYVELLGKINGVIFPGGGRSFNNINGYADAGEQIYKIAKELNDQGDYFPIWGTCLGFQLLTYLSANRTELRAKCFSQRQSLPLDFTNDYKSSKMFKYAPRHVISVLSEKNITSNFHSHCVTRENLTRFNIDNEWRIISENNDWNGFRFISSLESKNYPFYGTEFHPEKNQFEWGVNKNISHTKDAVLGNRYFADFFVSEARKNRHNFLDKDDEIASLIYNYRIIHTGADGVGYEQCYFFT